MSDTVQLPQNIKISEYSCNIKTKDKQKYINLNKPLLVQLPEMTSPYGISDGTYEGKPRPGGPLYTTQLKLNQDPLVSGATEALVAGIEKLIIDFILKMPDNKSLGTWKKDLTSDKFEEDGVFFRSISNKDDGKYMKVRFDFKKDSEIPMFSLFDYAKQTIAITSKAQLLTFEKGFRVVPILKFGSVSVTNDKFYVKWIVHAALMDCSKKETSSAMFISAALPSSITDRKEVVKQEETVAEPLKSEEEQDDEEEEEDEE